MAHAERSFRVMGSDARLLVVAADRPAAEALAAAGERRLARLEARWTRFRPTSELVAINAAPGPREVSAETAQLVALAVEAWYQTGGRFDPTVLDALEAAGYDRTFERVSGVGRVETVEGRGGPPSPSAGWAGPPPAVPGCEGIEVDVAGSKVSLPPGVRLDLGGIGKGHAADLVAAMLGDAGASGVCVDLGGDVRVAGTAPDGGAWAVAVGSPFDDADLGVVDLAAGAVATSSRWRRRWTTADGSGAHHLIDPATGRPARTDLVAVTVVAASAAWAEVHAKAALVAGSVAGVAALVAAGLPALAVTEDRDVLAVGAVDRFLRPALSAGRIQEPR